MATCSPSSPGMPGRCRQVRPVQAAYRSLNGQERSRPYRPPGSPERGGLPDRRGGASAGGLHAIEDLLQNTPADSGLAFVIVQHMDPERDDLLVELLQRATTMPVAQVTDRMPVVRDHVYVIPPGRDLTILHGVLHLLEPAQPHGLRLPIDFFFRSLAEDWGPACVGVILSGMGSDGTLGIRAIKEAGGAVFAQTASSAQFDSMPRSALASGFVDATAAPAELAEQILAYLRGVPALVGPPEPLAARDESAVEKIIAVLRDGTGHDLSVYKKGTVVRRIEHRRGLHQLGTITDYLRYLRSNAREVELLFKDLLISVTSFFRDPTVWEHLANDVLPGLVAKQPDGAVLRAWVPACATGEEAYTLAMVFREVVERTQPGKNLSLQIFATDLDRGALESGRAGYFPKNIAADVSAERLARFFEEDVGGYRVRKEVRSQVLFTVHDVLVEPPFTRLDLVSCRNLMIYLDPEPQRTLLALFHYCLNPGGVLVLGAAETVSAKDDFAPIVRQARIYRRVDRPEGAGPMAFPLRRPRVGRDPVARHPQESMSNLQAMTERLILRRYAPAAVVATESGEILYISGKTGRYLEPAAGKASMNLFAMARIGLDTVLPGLVHEAVTTRAVVTKAAVRVGTNGGTQLVDVSVEALAQPAALQGAVMVVFTDVAAAPAKKRSSKAKGAPHAAAIDPDLDHTLAELQTARAEMQTWQEETRSATEELQSANEELQSMNEELTTSKEELQSMNEELQTVNNELRAKVEEYSRVSSDMQNLLNSTDIATLFLDSDLGVRRFTTLAANVIRLLPSDTGRPITDLTTVLDYPTLADDARKVLATLTPKEVTSTTSDGRWYTVRIMPYRTQDNRIDGLVITFIDVSASKKLEAELRAAQARLSAAAVAGPPVGPPAARESP